MNDPCRHSSLYILPTSILAPSNLYAATWQWASGRGGDCLLGRGQHTSGLTGGIIAYFNLDDSWCTHGNDVVHICKESWDAIVVKYMAQK